MIFLIYHTLYWKGGVSVARTTLTLSQEALANLEELQSILSKKWASRVTQGFTVSYALKECLNIEHSKQENE